MSAYALDELVAITIYTGFGGVSLRDLDHLTLTQVTRVAGGQALAAFALAMIANNLLVHAAIAIDSGRSMSSLMRENQTANSGPRRHRCAAHFHFRWVYTV